VTARIKWGEAGEAGAPVSRFARRLARSGLSLEVRCQWRHGYRIKCTGGFVFGGYADAPWNASGGYSQSPKAFLISLHSPSGVGSVKLPLVQKQSPSVTAGTITTLHTAERARSQTPTPFAAARRSSQPSLRWSSHQVPPYRNGFSWSSSTLSL